MAPFPALDIFHDAEPRSAPLNMAIDEALFENCARASVRFYQWDHPALSFGYFGKYVDVADYANERELVRRWTGGGIVFHGEDLTYAIIIPSSDAAFSKSSQTIYAEVHQALHRALKAAGVLTTFAPAPAAKSEAPEAGACFANPVLADLMIDGEKVAGAAHRRNRRGLLHQGSVQGRASIPGLAHRWTAHLCDTFEVRHLSEKIVERAHAIADAKYAADSWLKKR